MNDQEHLTRQQARAKPVDLPTLNCSQIEFTMNDEIKERHKRDEDQANAVKHLVDHPLDLPSLERQVWHSYDLGDEPFLSAGYTWTDKPHRILHYAITEIRALRSFIANDQEQEREL